MKNIFKLFIRKLIKYLIYPLSVIEFNFINTTYWLDKEGNIRKISKSIGYSSKILKIYIERDSIPGLLKFFPESMKYERVLYKKIPFHKTLEKNGGGIDFGMTLGIIFRRIEYPNKLFVGIATKIIGTENEFDFYPRRTFYRGVKKIRIKLDDTTTILGFNYL